MGEDARCSSRKLRRTGRIRRRHPAAGLNTDSGGLPDGHQPDGRLFLEPSFVASPSRSTETVTDDRVVPFAHATAELVGEELLLAYARPFCSRTGGCHRLRAVARLRSRLCLRYRRTHRRRVIADKVGLPAYAPPSPRLNPTAMYCQPASPCGYLARGDLSGRLRTIRLNHKLECFGVQRAISASFAQDLSHPIRRPKTRLSIQTTSRSEICITRRPREGRFRKRSLNFSPQAIPCPPQNTATDDLLGLGYVPSKCNVKKFQLETGTADARCRIPLAPGVAFGAKTTTQALWSRHRQGDRRHRKLDQLHPDPRFKAQAPFGSNGKPFDFSRKSWSSLTVSLAIALRPRDGKASSFPRCSL